MKVKVYGALTANSHPYSATQAVLVRKIYQQKCARPSLDDMLNCLYDLQQRDDASKLHQAWQADDAMFGAAVRERFKESFLAVAEIQALEEMGCYETLSRENLKLKRVKAKGAAQRLENRRHSAAGSGANAYSAEILQEIV